MWDHMGAAAVLSVILCFQNIFNQDNIYACEESSFTLLKIL